MVPRGASMAPGWASTSLVWASMAPRRASTTRHPGWAFTKSYRLSFRGSQLSIHGSRIFERKKMAGTHICACMGKAVLFSVTKTLQFESFLLTWNCPFKKLFSNHKYVYVCWTMWSPLKEAKVFNKIITTLRVWWSKESGRLQRVWKTTKVRKTTRDTKNHKTMEDPGNQEIQEVRKSKEVRKSQRRLPSLKNPESQESGRLA